MSTAQIEIVQDTPKTVSFFGKGESITPVEWLTRKEDSSTPSLDHEDSYKRYIQRAILSTFAPPFSLNDIGTLTLKDWCAILMGYHEKFFPSNLHHRPSLYFFYFATLGFVSEPIFNLMRIPTEFLITFICESLNYGAAQLRNIMKTQDGLPAFLGAVGYYVLKALEGLFEIARFVIRAFTSPIQNVKDLFKSNYALLGDKICSLLATLSVIMTMGGYMALFVLTAPLAPLAVPIVFGGTIATEGHRNFVIYMFNAELKPTPEKTPPYQVEREQHFSNLEEEMEATAQPTNSF